MKKFFLAVSCALSVLAFVACESEPEINNAPEVMGEILQYFYDNIDLVQQNATLNTGSEHSPDVEKFSVSIDQFKTIGDLWDTLYDQYGIDKISFGNTITHKGNAADTPVKTRLFVFTFTKGGDSYSFMGYEEKKKSGWVAIESYKLQIDGEGVVLNTWKPAKD